MNFGIPSKTMDYILQEINIHPQIQRAAIFGSRAMGNYKNGSDIDIVLYGSSLSSSIVNQLSVRLNEELPLPYYFDIIHYEALAGTDPMKEHIDQYAVFFYGKPLAVES